MNQVQFFTHADIDVLQASVNEWLAAHPNVHIQQCNIDNLITPRKPDGDEQQEKYIFYILYSEAKPRRRKELLSMEQPLAAATMPEVTLTNMPISDQRADIQNKLSEPQEQN